MMGRQWCGLVFCICYLCACQFPVYRFPVVQGSPYPFAHTHALKQGQTPQEVRAILGPPSVSLSSQLVYYIWQDGAHDAQTLRLHYKQGKLDHWTVSPSV